MNQKNDNFIDKTFTVLADILLKVLPATGGKTSVLVLSITVCQHNQTVIMLKL